MKSLSFRQLLLASVSTLMLISTGSANAAFRAYLSVSGNDANPCTLAAPCRLLPAALAVADPGGEVWMLDSANFNSSPVNITKSVTILAVPGALGSVVAAGGDAIVVDTASISVTLRNIVVLNFSAGGHGINFLQGTRVILEGCEIYGLPLNGINATAPGGTVSVIDSTIRQNGGAGVHLAGTVTGNLSNAKVMHHTTGVNALDGARLYVMRSLITNSANFGIFASATGARTDVVITESVIKNASGSALSLVSNSGSQAYMTVARSTVNNAGTCINISGAGNGTLLLDGNVVVHCTTAVNMNNSSLSVLSRGNNTISLSNAGIVNGTFTPISAF